MRGNRTGRWVLAAAGLLPGCAQTVVSNHEDVRTCEGVRFYGARPVTVPTRTNSCGEPLAYQTLWVPDTTRPQYVRQAPGLGDGGFTLGCEEGVATKLDVKAPTTTVNTVLDATAKLAVIGIGIGAAKKELDK